VSAKHAGTIKKVPARGLRKFVTLSSVRRYPHFNKPPSQLSMDVLFGRTLGTLE